MEITGHTLLLSLVNAIDVGIVVLELDSKEVVWLNRFAQQQLSRMPAGLDNTDWLVDLIAREVTHEPPNAEQKKLRHNGRVVGYTIHHFEPNLAGIFFRDITDKERLDSLAAAMNVMENIGFVFSGIRHELGNPINSLKVTLSVLRKTMDKASPDTVTAYLDRSLAELARVEYLLNSLKTYSLFEHLTITDVDLSAFFDRFVALVAQDLRQKAISLACDIAPRSVVKADPRALQQVLLNVVHNAVDALDGRPAPKISITGRMGLAFFEIVIRDNGHGMTQDDVGKIFKPFHTTKEKGTGLGMSLAKNMMATMQGDIKAESVPESGTAIFLELRRS